MRKLSGLAAALAFAVPCVLLVSSPAGAQAAKTNLPKTPWGDPSIFRGSGKLSGSCET